MGRLYICRIVAGYYIDGELEDNIVTTDLCFKDEEPVFSKVSVTC